MNDADRIKLAEAAGWDVDEYGNVNVQGKGWKAFLPETDANDDYVVLSWARNTWKPAMATMEHHHKWPTFVAALKPTSDRYHIGDYARAALKVLKK